MSPEKPELQSAGRPLVGLFATCLVNAWRPGIGLAAAELIERAGCEVRLPPQTCCGQPSYNSGDNDTARELALKMVGDFADCDYVVVPSGSCAAMIKLHHPTLFEPGSDRDRVAELAGRCHELFSFLVDVRGLKDVDAEYPQKVAYHDGCSGLRELGVHDAPRALLAKVRGCELREIGEGDVCCGFGGVFCVKYPQISTRLVTDRIEAIRDTGATTLAGGDLGCLLNIAGRALRLGVPLRVHHAAEILTGADKPIGE